MSNLNILILTGSFGDGHLQVARVLRTCLMKKGIQRVRILDLYAEAHPFINQVMRYAYIKSYSLAPSLYGWMYGMTRDMEHTRFFAKLLNAFGMKKLREVLNDEQPDVVIHTFPVLAMPELRVKMRIGIPTYTVITDFSLHQRWIHAEIDKYYVATEDLKREMVRRRVPEEKIVVSGIPIRESFDHFCTTSAVYQKYQLNPFKKTILVLAGAYGVLRNTKQICEFLARDNKLQVVVVCGKNKILQKKMEAHFAGVSSVKVFGFVEHIHELMGIASCMITKAGGVTLSEAIAMGLPTVIFRPVPGQEKENAEYLTQKGAALTFDDVDHLQEQLIPLLHDDDRLFEMRRANV
ncbi:MAG: glycosyltransferase, partial [Alicyclobacillaceae bacterium]|nr:glycosyltransferase [Alicyclobacillaceae bacterium]